MSHFSPTTNAQDKGQFRAGPRGPVVCLECTLARLIALSEEPKDSPVRALPFHPVASMDIRAHKRWVHPNVKALKIKEDPNE